MTGKERAENRVHFEAIAEMRDAYHNEHGRFSTPQDRSFTTPLAQERLVLELDPLGLAAPDMEVIAR